MERLRFLEVVINERTYLCEENILEKVVALEIKDLYNSPFGPDWLRYLYPYEGVIIPVIKEHREILTQKMYNILIVRKMLNFVGIIVDRVKGFTMLGREMVESALPAPVFLAKKALNIDDKEYFLLDIDALFEGKE
jgi:chemotaxis signal transduction protein